MDGLNSKIWIDTGFIEKLRHLPDDIEKTAARALQKTNHWLRTVTQAELGYALQIDTKSALKTRFRSYKKGGMKTTLWVGIRNIGVHRLGTPAKKGKGVQVGKHFFDKAFIAPMNSSELLVFRRTGKSRKSLEMVMLDISSEAEEILGSYQSELNKKFEEFFNREFRLLQSAE